MMQLAQDMTRPDIRSAIRLIFSMFRYVQRSRKKFLSLEWISFAPELCRGSFLSSCQTCMPSMTCRFSMVRGKLGVTRHCRIGKLSSRGCHFSLRNHFANNPSQRVSSCNEMKCKEPGAGGDIVCLLMAWSTSCIKITPYVLVLSSPMSILLWLFSASRELIVKGQPWVVYTLCFLFLVHLLR